MDDSEAGSEATSSDIPFEQTPFTETLIWSICRYLGADWTDLGSALDVESAVMDDIDTDHNESHEKARRVLLKWKRKKGKGATMGILIEALEEIGRKDVAEKLLETRDVKKRLSCTRELIGDLQRKLEKFGEDVNASIQGIETKFLQLEICASTGNSVLENLKQETARAGEILEDVQERTKMILGKSFELEDIALDKMIERRARAQEVKSGLADRTKEDDGQKNGESQTREAATMDREKIQLLCDVEQTGELQAEKEGLKLKLQVQTDPEELDQLKPQNGDLSSQIEELNKKLKSSESECKRLQEELEKYNKFRSRVFLPTKKEFVGNCSGVICFLKRDASAKLRASRSSDGPGEASDILNHNKSAISGTAERENSWWSVDLGLSHRLVITHYSLRQGKRHGESALTDWQLEGSYDGKNWEELKTIHNGKDPQFAAPPPFYTGTWSVAGEIPAFRFFRIFQTRRNSSGKYGIYLSGIELYGVLLNI